MEQRDSVTGRIGVVVIGRNEGERLQRCLKSVIASERPIVYVDSGSSDGSVGLAAAMGALVVELDPREPFSAARARNEGFARLMVVAPGVEFVQFVDGDCELDQDWVGGARAHLQSVPSVSVVCGRLRERAPHHSLYNRVADCDWNTRAGDVPSCGGVAMMRSSVFSEVGGFDRTIVAGEEAELCLRIRRQGGRIHRLDSAMAVHDMAMTRFSQWWLRQVRGGYGALDVATRFGHEVFKRQVWSARLWVLGWPGTVVGAIAVGLAQPGPWAVALLCLAAMTPIAQTVRIGVRSRRRGAAWRLALCYGGLAMMAKAAQFTGQVRYWQDRIRGRGPSLIEHKAIPRSPVPCANRLSG